MPTVTQKFTATLSNSWNSDAKASQGGYKSSSSTGATATTRTGTFKFTGLGALKGKAITGISWYLKYAEAGKDAKKVVTFTSPSFNFTSGVYAYGESETRTVSSSSHSALYTAIINAINGSGSLTLTMKNGETKTTRTDSAGGSYTENYLHVTSSYFNITYITSLPSYVYTNIRSLKTYPAAGMTKNSNSQSCSVSASSTYSDSYPAYLAFDYKNDTCWASSKSATGPYVIIQMPYALYDCTVTLKNRTHASYNIGGFISGRIDGSNDGTNFTTLTTFSGRDGKTSGHQNSYALNNSTTAYKYIKVKADTWDKTEDTYACIGEMRVTGYTIPSTGGWQEATAYIYQNGAWVAAAPNVYNNSQWMPG